MNTIILNDDMEPEADYGNDGPTHVSSALPPNQVPRQTHSHRYSSFHIEGSGAVVGDQYNSPRTRKRVHDERITIHGNATIHITHNHFYGFDPHNTTLMATRAPDEAKDELGAEFVNASEPGLEPNDGSRLISCCRHIKVILICWDLNDLDVGKEYRELQKLFGNFCGFETKILELGYSPDCNQKVRR